MDKLQINIIQEMRVMAISEVRKIFNVPDFQRDIDIDHVQEIRKSIMADLSAGRTPILPGCFIIAVLPNDEHLLIDGNHRFNALCDVEEDLRVFVNIIYCQSREEAETLFKKTNNNLPMIQLPPAVKMCNIKPIMQYYKSQYSKLFSNSKSGNCHRPNLHERHFGEAIAALLEAGYTEQQIKAGISEYNYEISTRLPKTFRITTNDTIKKMSEYLETCTTKGGFYLGMVCHNTDYSKLLERFKIYTNTTLRRAIGLTKGQRIDVWNKYHGDSRFAKCRICDAQIAVTDFHCAHDIAHKNGGAETLENLYPCCATCNLTMGDMSLSDLAT
jgi:hypothetical protein